MEHLITREPNCFASKAKFRLRVGVDYTLKMLINTEGVLTSATQVICESQKLWMTERAEQQMMKTNMGLELKVVEF